MPRPHGEHLAIQLLWATARLLVTRASLIYLVHEFSIFSFLVLLREVIWRGELKISSCCFCAWCKSRNLRSRGSPRFPCVTPVVKSFFSDLLRAMISYWEELHLEPCQISTMEHSCKNNQWV